MRRTSVQKSALTRSTYLLADPSAFEESLLTGVVRVGVSEDTDADVFYCQQMGDASCLSNDAKPRQLDGEQLLERCIDEARARADEVRSLLKKSLNH